MFVPYFWPAHQDRRDDGERPNRVDIQRENESKERITIRLDAEVLAWFRERVKGGGNYQTLISDTLRAAMDDDSAP